MICPHCGVAFSYRPDRHDISPEEQLWWFAYVALCPECKRLIVQLEHQNKSTNEYLPEFLVYPRSCFRQPPPEEVSSEAPSIADDYRQACLVLQDSPKASAALSRRCLQGVLIEKAGVNQKDNLSKQIQHVLDSKVLPSYLGEALDSIRAIGNFAAHPMKSTSTGEIQDVEPKEAEWTLDTLETLFDFYYVQPAILKKKKDALNSKLKDSDRDPIKQP